MVKPQIRGDYHGKDGLLLRDCGHAGSHGEAPGWVRRQRERGQLLSVQEGPGETGKAGLGLAGASETSGLWDRGAAPGCLVCDSTGGEFGQGMVVRV